MSTTLRPWRSALSYTVIALFVAITVLPFVYMILLSLQTEAETFAGVPVIFPAIPQWHNYVEIWRLAPFGRLLSIAFSLPARSRSPTSASIPSPATSSPNTAFRSSTLSSWSSSGR